MIKSYKLCVLLPVVAEQFGRAFLDDSIVFMGDLFLWHVLLLFVRVGHEVTEV